MDSDNLRLRGNEVGRTADLTAGLGKGLAHLKGDEPRKVPLCDSETLPSPNGQSHILPVAQPVGCCSFINPEGQNAFGG